MSSSRQQSEGNGGISTQTASRKCEMVKVPFPAPVVKMIGGVMGSVTAQRRISDGRDGFDDFLESFEKDQS